MKKYILSLAVLLCMLVMTGCTGSSYLMSKDVSETEIKDSAKEDEPKEQDLIFVQITGAVACPGVYEVDKEARLFEVVRLAGGFLEDAAADFVNQAEKVKDGQNIRIPWADEVMVGSDVYDGRININKADVSELMTLRGIGEAKAEQIVEYREENGSFASIEDIMNIPGIKEGVFNKIKDDITVGY